MPISERVFLFFDVDGVLIEGYHHLIEHRRWWHQTIQKDLGISQEVLERYFTSWSDVITGKKTLQETMTDFLKTENLPHTAQDIIDYWFEKDSNIDPVAWKTVSALAQYPDLHLYLATNQEKNRAEHLWNTLNFKSIFRGMFYSGKMGLTKNSPDFFRRINNDLSIDQTTDTVIYFDDTPACLENAALAGWSGVQVTTSQDILNNTHIQKRLGKDLYYV